MVQDRFLPGVPGDDIERILNAAPGNEIESGKFDHPESSAALAVNTFGFFLHRAADLPLLPGCERVMWPASSLSVETTVRFPWSGGVSSGARLSCRYTFGAHRHRMQALRAVSKR